MIYIHPEFLWGLLAMIIPIIIHLFDFRKNKKVYFSDIRFLKQVEHSSKKPLKLKQWLILLSRLAFVFFLVIMFAQPIIPSASNKQLQQGTKIIYIDNSQSMSAMVNPKETAIERAKIIGAKIINQLPKGQEVIILSNNNLSQFFTPNTLTEASKLLSTINLSDKTFSLNQLGVAISKYKKRNTNVSDVFIISDFQKSTLPIELHKLDTALTYWLAPIKAETINNCVVDSIFLAESIINENGNTQIEVIINNLGNQLKENLPIKVFMGNRQVSAASITIAAHQKKSISFSLGKVNEIESGYIQIEDYPTIFDNIFNFSLPPKRRLNILEITGNNSSSYIKPVFGNENLFAFFSNNFQNIDNAILLKADFVVLNQIDNPSIELINKLKSYASTQGSVLVIPTLTPNLNAYHQLSASLVKTGFPQKQKLKSPTGKNPFFISILENVARKIEMPSITSVWAWGKDRSAVLLFEDGTPYLSEIAQNLYIVSAPLIDSMSNFQSHALFVPVMYRLASQSVTPTSTLFSRVENNYFDLRMDSISFKDLIKLSKDELEIVPSKTKIGNKWRINFPKEIITTGIYKVENNKLIKGYLAINLAKKESQLAALNKSEITNLFLGYTINFLEAFNPNSTILNSFDTGIALWKYALTICLLFLLLETLFIRFL